MKPKHYLKYLCNKTGNGSSQSPFLQYNSENACESLVELEAAVESQRVTSFCLKCSLISRDKVTFIFTIRKKAFCFILL